MYYQIKQKITNINSYHRVFNLCWHFSYQIKNFYKTAMPFASFTLRDFGTYEKAFKRNIKLQKIIN